jgi:hypothetical protein
LASRCFFDPDRQALPDGEKDPLQRRRLAGVTGIQQAPPAFSLIPGRRERSRDKPSRIG